MKTQFKLFIAIVIIISHTWESNAQDKNSEVLMTIHSEDIANVSDKTMNKIMVFKNGKYSLNSSNQSIETNSLVGQLSTIQLNQLVKLLRRSGYKYIDKNNKCINPTTSNGRIIFSFYESSFQKHIYRQGM